MFFNLRGFRFSGCFWRWLDTAAISAAFTKNFGIGCVTLLLRLTLRGRFLATRMFVCNIHDRLCLVVRARAGSDRRRGDRKDRRYPEKNLPEAFIHLFSIYDFQFKL